MSKVGQPMSISWSNSSQPDFVQALARTKQYEITQARFLSTKPPKAGNTKKKKKVTKLTLKILKDTEKILKIQSPHFQIIFVFLRSFFSWFRGPTQNGCFHNLFGFFFGISAWFRFPTQNGCFHNLFCFFLVFPALGFCAVIRARRNRNSKNA